MRTPLLTSDRARRSRGYVKAGLIVSALFFLIAVSYMGIPDIFSSTFELTQASEEVAQVLPPQDEVEHLPTPEPLKAIYMTSCVAGTPSLRKGLVELVEQTEVNAIIIDIKDYTGTISFEPQDPELKEFVASHCFVRDLKEFIAELHEKGIYVIGRVTVFQDPFLAKRRPDLAVKKASDATTWKDNKGLSFTDPGSKEVRDHAIKIARESYAIGFDEINFDYIRFPSDGPMKDIHFTWSDGRAKSDVIEEFFKYLHDSFRPDGKKEGPVLSADLFGMVTTNTDDLNIGQVLEKALPYFDYIAPMVYPSHYPQNFNGWGNPNLVPYEIIKYSMDKAVERTIATSTVIKTIGSEPIASTSPQLYTKPSWSKQKLRTWIQDFDYGGNYDAPEVRAQIKATYDAGLTSWMIWAPSNRYTREALLPE